MFDLEAHLKRQMAFSHATFGPGERMQGVIDHIRKELIEVEEANGESSEWVDVVILALDGLTRRLAYVNGNRRDAKLVAEIACHMIEGKQTCNEERVWPDWRSSEPNKAITHIKTKDVMYENLIRKFPVALNRKNWPQYTTYSIVQHYKGGYAIRERIFNNPNEVYYNYTSITKEEARYLIHNGMLKANDDKILQSLGTELDS